MLPNCSFCVGCGSGGVWKAIFCPLQLVTCAELAGPVAKPHKEVGHQSGWRAGGTVCLSGKIQLVEICQDSWLLDVEESLWNACSCEESRWKAHTVGPRDDGLIYGRAEDWMLPYLGMKLEDGKMGGPGSGNLLAFNLMLQERLQERLVEDGGVQTMVVKLLHKIGHDVSKQKQKGSWWKGQAVSVIGGMKVSSDWPGTVGMLFSKAREGVVNRKTGTTGGGKAGKCKAPFLQYRTVRQTRPGALMEVATTLGLLLNAAAPIVKRVARERSVAAKPNLLTITTHVMFDLLLCTSAMVMAAGGLMMQPFVDFADTGISFALHSLKQLLPVLQNVPTTDQMQDEAMNYLLTNTFRTSVQQFINEFTGKIVAGLTLGKVQILKILAGASLFWVLSALLAHQAAPKRLKLSLSSCLFVGPCGPLVLFAKIPEESVMQLSGYVEQQVASRGLLVLLPLVLSWMSMDANAMRMSLGLLLGRLVQPVPFWAFWGVAIVVHAISGFAAVAAVCRSHKTAQKALAASAQKPDIEKPPHSPDEARAQPVPPAERRRTVTGPSGTFLAPPRPVPPTRKSIRRSAEASSVKSFTRHAGRVWIRRAGRGGDASPRVQMLKWPNGSCFLMSCSDRTGAC